MATYSRQERLAAIQKAGFSDPLTALAVSLAEFGENRDINAQAQSDVYTNGVRESSFGPWQIHLPAHPDVTQSCAMDLTCSTSKAAEISKGGTDFGAWSAFTNGSYARFLDEIKSGIAPIAAGPAAGSSTGDCRDFVGLDQIRVVTMNMQGNTPQQIADALGVSLSCLKTRVGGMIGATESVPGVVGGATALSSVNSVGTFLGQVSAPDNLWRAGFLIVGAVMLFAGARMYLAPDRSEVGREVVA